MRRLHALALAGTLLALALAPLAGAAESDTCDGGPLQGVQIQIDGSWYSRPDSRIDGLPRTLSTGAFKVSATVTAGWGVAAVTLFYIIDNVKAAPLPMALHQGVAAAAIPKLTNLGYGDHYLGFYLTAYDANANNIWTDEIPSGERPCNERGDGDPYNFLIRVPAPFEGEWRAEATPNEIPEINIVTTRASTGSLDPWSAISYHVIQMGKKGDIARLERAEPVAWNTLETATRTLVWEDGSLYVIDATGTTRYVAKKTKK